MKYNLIFKLAGVVLGVSTAYGSLLESAQQNSSTEALTHQYEKYSIYTGQLVEKGRAEGKAEGRAEGRAEGIASIIRSGLLSYDSFMRNDQYSEDIKAQVKQLLEAPSQ
ncbi:MAG: hypothetical protein H6492_00595 [Candidatus Paracaedibacteraceae bacterium]|nr:hypothetical protein [Candidatus Paracaedibacteraceae bacterium]